MSVVVFGRSTPFHSGSGGMESVSWDLAQGLAQHTDVLFVTTTVPGWPEHFEAEGVTVHALAGTAPGRYSFGWWWKSFLFGRTLRDASVLSVSAGGASVAWIQKRRRSGPFVWQAHGTSLTELTSLLSARGLGRFRAMPRSVRWIAIDLLTMRRFDTVVAVSESVEAKLSAKLYSAFRHPARLVAIPNAIAVSEFADEQLSTEESEFVTDEDTILLVAGRLDWQKGADQAVQAMPFLGSTTKLLIAGEGPERERIQRQVERLSLENRVEFLGPIPRDELRQLMRTADVLVLPCRNGEREGLPMVILEGLGAGTGIVVSSEVGLPSDLDALVSRADSSDPRDLAEAIAGESRSSASRLPDRYLLASSVRAYAKELGVAAKALP